MNAPLRLHWPFSSYLPTVDVKQPAVLSLMKKVIFLCCVTALNSDSLLRAVAIFTMPTRCSCWLVVFLLPLIPSPTEYIYLRKWYRDILSTTVSFCINATVMFNVIHCTTTTATTMDNNNSSSSKMWSFFPNDRLKLVSYEIGRWTNSRSVMTIEVGVGSLSEI